MTNEKSLKKAELNLRMLIGSHPDPAAQALLGELVSEVFSDLLGELPFHLADMRYAHRQLSIVATPERRRQANRLAQRHNQLRRWRQLLRQLRWDLNRPEFIAINDARLNQLSLELAT